MTVREPDAPRYRGLRVPSARRACADYGAGVFFVTVVTAARVLCLGRVEGARTRLSAAGRIVRDEWRHTAIVRPGVTLDAFVVMPDHVHGVLWIDGDGRTAADIEAAADIKAGGGVETPRRGVSTVGRADAAFVGAGPSGGDTASARPWRPGVLGAIVARFKSACTRRIRAEVDAGVAWQPRFYDVLVRDARRLAAVRRYILTNPAR